jgi:hypothetical protein
MPTPFFPLLESTKVLHFVRPRLVTASKPLSYPIARAKERASLSPFLIVCPSFSPAR